MKTTNFIIILIAILITGVFSYFLWQEQKTAAPKQRQTSSKSSQNQTKIKPAVNPEPEQKTSLLSYEIQGMKVEVLKMGAGEPAKKGDKVKVHYVGALLNGKKFDSSIDREDPFSFVLGENSVIKGWELGVLGMRAGEERKLTIPPELGYGSQGAGGIIPPVATLIFEVELVGIN